MANSHASGSDSANVCREVFEASPEPIAAVSGADHIVQFVNPAFCRLAGKGEEELTGNAFRDALAAGEECLALLERVYQTGQAETYIGEPHSVPDGLYWSYVMWPVTSEDGGPGEIVIKVTETTSLHRQATAMNQELLISSLRQHELTESAERLNGKLRQANEDRKQFSFAVSHDLQEPLRMIAIYSELLVKGYRGRIDDDASALLGFISKGAEQMQQLLANLLVYTSMGEEASDPAAPIYLNSIVEKVIEDLRAASEESGANITHDDLPAVRGHAVHFAQLFRNLIANAIKYRGDQKPQIRISAERIAGGPKTIDPQGEWRFAVADNGIGISPRYHAKLFDAFHRLHGKEIPGTGMGLAICKRVVERYGGRIWVESQGGQGTTFYFTLPVMLMSGERTL
jgi:PAS domain S-box-containing protein